MIYVRVEMWPKGSHARRYSLGEALIENLGGSKSKADYRVLLSKKGGFASSDEAMARMQVSHVWKEVLIPDFPRAYLGSWYLIASALQSACGKALARIGRRPGARVAERALDAALAEVRRQGGPDYLLTEARNEGLAVLRGDAKVKPRRA